MPRPRREREPVKLSERTVKIELCELSIVIVAQSNNPTILNPDFLHHNGIVDRRWALDEAFPPLTSPVMSQVAFKGGFVVRANPANVSFTLTVPDDESATLDAEPCVDSAKGYLKTVPHVPYIALGVNPKAVERNSAPDRVSNALKPVGDWMTFQSVAPRFELKATYEYGDKTTTFSVAEEQTGASYQANIHRDVTGFNQQMRVNTMLATLDAWQSDLADFLSLAERSLLQTGAH